ncbi:MAG: DNA recombination protein RmuC [Candidatus Vogelbacteria bacterium CG10_big_fil_rev_8_21_14_0_10_50_13]|uniref:DNA recombination protein RmuC n=1 Tax=Candidatus Vogelbacteria bacterium CG10_big_fil_rev_8_21_14_0_10_50_13 TaxID=1975044 RepID=A0A2H0RFX3_9BACT|nr:MAG: DNA recombination protein RmuC [Candidatus Vogelbacteria bacterium CG10_big_fil_rev_8_21_14_0_10_50_13]
MAKWLGRGGAKVEEGSMLLLQQQLQELTRTVDQKLTESSKNIHDSVQTQFRESAGIIRDVTERLTKLDETNRQVISFTDQLKSLQDILKNPKQRGVLGEYYLETLLKNVLPPGSYQMQYPFKDGTIVDAVVFVKEKIIPIDSKFSLENYNRAVEERDPTERKRLEKVFENDLKNRIVETAKYVQPSQGTMDFAFMFIPHEAIYYDLLVGKVGLVSEENLIQRAASRYKVIIVSPTSFLAYLQTVLQGLKALKIEEQAVDIRKRVEDLGKHIFVYDDYMKKLGNTLGTTVNHYNSAYKEFKKVDKDILRIAEVGGNIEPLALERPDVVE